MKIGFDHSTIIKDTFELLKKYAFEYNERIFDLLPKTFTLSELQQVFEEILQSELTLL